MLYSHILKYIGVTVCYLYVDNNMMKNWFFAANYD